MASKQYQYNRENDSSKHSTNSTDHKTFSFWSLFCHFFLFYFLLCPYENGSRITCGNTIKRFLPNLITMGYFLSITFINLNALYTLYNSKQIIDTYTYSNISMNSVWVYSIIILNILENNQIIIYYSINTSSKVLSLILFFKYKYKLVEVPTCNYHTVPQQYYIGNVRI